MDTTWRLTPTVVVHSRNLPTTSSFTTQRAVVLIFTFFIYVSYHLSRKPISVVKSVLYQTCNVSVPNCSGSWKPFDGPNYQTLLGSLDYAYLFAYAIGMFVSGHIAERTNLRHFLTVGMVLSGIFTALFGFGRYWNIHFFWYFLFVQLFGGLFQSTGWPAVVTCVANWFGKGRRGLVMGLWNSHTSIGNILGSVIAGAFVEYNWGLSFIIPGAIIACLAVPVSMFLVPHPRDAGLEVPDEGKDKVTDVRNSGLEAKPLLTDQFSEKPQAITFMRALKIPGVVEFSLCLFFAKLVSYTFLFWLPSYIENTAKLSPGVSAYLSALFDVGGIIGGICAGMVSDYLGGGRALTCLVMLLLAAPSLLLYNLFGSSHIAVNVLLLAVCGALVNGPYCLITTAVSADLGTHPSLQGNAMALATVTAIIDGTGSMGAALGPLLTGIISPTGWRNVFYMLITADLLAFLISWHIYNSYDQRQNGSNGLSVAGDSWCARFRISIRATFCRGVTIMQCFIILLTMLILVVLFIIFPAAHSYTREIP